MKLLALDSSGLVASVAVLEDDSLLAEYTVNYKKTHSQTLLPMLDTVAQMIELNLMIWMPSPSPPDRVPLPDCVSALPPPRVWDWP